MYEVRIDQQKNRLYFTLKGFLKAEEIKRATAETIAQMRQLPPGFCVITNISEFAPATPEAAEHIKQMQAVSSQLGVKKVVRVVKSAVSSLQFKRTQREAGAKYETCDVHSVAEAEQLLDAEVQS